MCRKIALFGLCAEILLARNQGLLDSRAGPFLGSVKKYRFFGEIFTSAVDRISENSVDNVYPGKRCLQDLKARGQSQLQITHSQVTALLCWESSMNDVLLGFGFGGGQPGGFHMSFGICRRM